jgi:hypothetical protein
VSVMPNVIYDKLNHNSLVPTSMHLQLADQLIRRPIGIVEDIPVKIRNSFIYPWTLWYSRWMSADRHPSFLGGHS